MCGTFFSNNCSNNDFNHNIENIGCCHYDCHSLIFLCVSQRIAAADLAPGLQYFGRSIHGTMDMNNDGLVDLAVGSLGAAVLLWLAFHSVNNTVVKNIRHFFWPHLWHLYALTGRRVLSGYTPPSGLSPVRSTSLWRTVREVAKTWPACQPLYVSTSLAGQPSLPHRKLVSQWK